MRLTMDHDLRLKHIAVSGVGKPENTLSKYSFRDEAELQAALSKLLHTIRTHVVLTESREHGEQHWKQVAVVGWFLAQSLICDPLIILLFSLFHDALRHDDGDDWEHGQRAGALARFLFASDLSFLSSSQMDLLEAALCFHHLGERLPEIATSGSPTIGACWDADRLNLPRGGIEPNLVFLSTAVAKKGETIAWAKQLLSQKVWNWTDIFVQYSPLLKCCL